MIDRKTVEKIIDAADIVDVVSDFVNLRRRGANYIGLCPFHNEKTPSFSVSRAKGICKCFSCGKGGTAVNFIMEHEQMTYYEALKYLAKKYNIEVVEKELTVEEKQEQTDRENMLSVNEFAMRKFEDNIFNTPEGRNIGLSYFYDRGFTDDIIKKFHLGYSLDNSTALYEQIKDSGFSVEHAIATGLCGKSNDRIYDRFKGRVMFPVLNISGKVIAFGGRTLHPDRDKAKYINSPESTIYKKSYELYGLFQAKKSIVKNDKCYLVEGYTDVLSMHQAGIENVVASSGTSLTEGQIRLIHRFTNDITVLYDGDAAGIKASLRGIDMILAEGINVKVLLLPDGDDPDSFAKKHNATYFQDYIKSHETDFIIFKTAILLQGLENDPIKRAEAISSIVRSISVIPDPITRSVYIQECSKRFEMDEKLLVRAVNKDIRDRRNKTTKPAASETDTPETVSSEITAAVNKPKPQQQPADSVAHAKAEARTKFLEPFEKEVVCHIVRYGMMPFSVVSDVDNSVTQMTVVEFINSELKKDGFGFSSPNYQKINKKALSFVEGFREDQAVKLTELAAESNRLMTNGISEIRTKCDNLEAIQREESLLKEKVDLQIAEMLKQFQSKYLVMRLCSDSDDSIRTISLDLADEKYQLSKVHSKMAKIEKESDRLNDLVPNAILAWKDAILAYEVKHLQQQIRDCAKAGDLKNLDTYLSQLSQINEMRMSLAKLLGDRVIIPS